ncbi:sortase [Agathobaculum sp.]|uniref:sortase n=1 Tax=Agathobaculum sp. TaxID=2048138 RepID=UPI002A830E25|nr:class D sortase [Agathobaculum sp.]MDY3617826.1 class D sortase [Agathobaculum sp.]
MAKNSRKKLERGLLITGLALAVIGLVYEGANYPWGVLFGQQSVPDDPAPVSAEWVETSNAEESVVYLPGEEGYDEAEPAEAPLQAGVIKIPRLELADNIVEGVDQPSLKLGVGHMPGTALPGQSGNCVLAGHRPRALLRHLDMIGENDQILLSDQDNVYTYEVFRTLTVEPTEVWVTEPVDGRESVMTLFTCTPYMVSTHRLVVQAELVSSEPRV